MIFRILKLYFSCQWAFLPTQVLPILDGMGDVFQLKKNSTGKRLCINCIHVVHPTEPKTVTSQLLPAICDKSIGTDLLYRTIQAQHFKKLGSRREYLSQDINIKN